MRLQRIAPWLLVLGLFVPLFQSVGPESTAPPVVEIRQLSGVARGMPVPGEYIHTDAVKKKLVCADPTGSDNTSMVEVWKLPATGLIYKINTNSLPSGLDTAQVVLAVQTAASTWVAQGASPLVYGGTVTSNGSITDGVNVIGFGTTPSGTVSVASMRIVAGVVAEADITMDVTDLWSTNTGNTGKGCTGAPNKIDIQNTLVHEFGHWIGAAHAPAMAQYSHRSMYPDIAPGELAKRTLMLGDIASIPTPTATATTGGYTGIETRAGDDSGGP